MAPWIIRRFTPKRWRRVPWSMVWAAAVWLLEQGRERVERNLSKKERQELVRLVQKSMGRPSNLSGRERSRLKDIAGKAIRG
jgi:hypothetical protein